MIYPGLVSITFRQLQPADVVNLVSRAGLSAIEWGGDVHVPHGDIKQAANAKMMTLDAGLQVAAYGSYYRVGHPEAGLFEATLETAYELGAPVIRVWPGKQGSNVADEAYWDLVVADSRRIADFAAQVGINIVYEFHAKTLTDTATSTLRLLNAVAHDNIKSLWQPPRYSTLEDNLSSLDAVLPWLHNLHLFSWHQETGERLPLAAEQAKWQQYLHKASTTGRDHFALLEFVKGDSPEQFLEDAATLKKWLSALIH